MAAQRVLTFTREAWDEFAPQIGSRSVEYTPGEITDEDGNPSGVLAICHPNLDEWDETLVEAWNALADTDTPGGQP